MFPQYMENEPGPRIQRNHHHTNHVNYVGIGVIVTILVGFISFAIGLLVGALTNLVVIIGVGLLIVFITILIILLIIILVLKERIEHRE